MGRLANHAGGHRQSGTRVSQSVGHEGEGKCENPGKRHPGQPHRGSGETQRRRHRGAGRSWKDHSTSTPT